jgi:choline dehydrogenase-like flavoprotein
VLIDDTCSNDDPDIKEFPRISKPVELLRNKYDVVIIGSGYGGSVAASRMARAGQSVCLLERGKEKWPGEYPSGLLDAAKEVHISGEFAPGFLKGSIVEAGDPTGLYHLIVGKGQNVFVGNGLGGTSLLNANIFLKTDPGTMTLDAWPEDLQKPGALKEYYKRAADVLEPKSYPMDWPILPKLELLQKQQKALGKGKFYRPLQTTRFEGGPNSTGVEMYPSALTVSLPLQEHNLLFLLVSRAFHSRLHFSILNETMGSYYLPSEATLTRAMIGYGQYRCQRWK